MSLCLLVTTLLVALPASSHAESQSGLVGDGFVPSSHEGNFAELDPGARKLFDIGQPVAGVGMRVVVRDLDSFELLRTITIDDAQSGFGGAISAVDEARHRLFVLYPYRHVDETAARQTLGSNSGPVDAYDRVVFGIAVVDTISMRLLGTRLIPDVLASPRDLQTSNSIGVKALSYFAPEDKLYMVTQVPTGLNDLTISNHGVFAHELDASRLLDTSAVSVRNWSYPLVQCAKPMSRESSSSVLRLQGAQTLFIPCSTGAILGPFVQPLETPGMVRLSVAPGTTTSDTSNFTSDFFPISGDLQWGWVAVDPVSERFLVEVNGSTTEAVVWIFEARTASWLGAIVLPSEFAGPGTTGLAVDVSLGRLYAISASLPNDPNIEAVVASTRVNEIDQGYVASFVPTRGPSTMKPVVDPIRHRIFGAATGGYSVIRDTVPAVDQQSAVKPDVNTTGQEEGPDTAVNFLGGTQAYGLRFKFVGGGNGVQSNVNVVFENPPDPRPEQWSKYIAPDPAPGTRDFHFARVFKTTLTGGESSAKAAGADRDLQNTDTDFVNGTTWFNGYATCARDPNKGCPFEQGADITEYGGPDFTAYSGYFIDNRWPFTQAFCTDFGQNKDKRDDAQLGAKVTCRQPDTSVEARAVGRTPMPTGAFRVAGTTASTKSFRDPKLGIVSIAEAETVGVDLGGVAGIGRVTAKATTWARGRKGTAGSTYERTFEDVWVKGTDGRHVAVCAALCPADVVRDALRLALGARARVEFPGPDPTRRGTPGGYEALIVRSPTEQANEISVNEEDGIRNEIPALTVTIFADGRTRLRGVMSVAAVSAESHYGIYSLSTSLPPIDTGGFKPNNPGTGPVGVPLPPVVAPPAPRVSEPGFATVFRQTVEGVRFLLRTPGRSARAFGLWVFLATPLVLMMRRRALGGV